jgi:hypothetical protein
MSLSHSLSTAHLNSIFDKLGVRSEELSMFVDELTPILKKLAQQPVAFLGGFVSGLLRLNLNDDPVKSWLDKQAGATLTDKSGSATPNSKSHGPQTITIE